MERLPIFKVGLETNFIDLLFGFTEDDGPAVPAPVHVDEVCDD